MKKILSVSILAMLAVAPLSAKADTVYQTQKATADATTDGGIAAVGYVKGAYNAAIGVIETENARATGAETTLGNRIGTLADDGNYIKDSAEKNVSENLVLLDTAVKANADHIGNMANISADGAVAGQTNLVGAVNALNTAVGNAGTAATVGTGHNYIGATHFTDSNNSTQTTDDDNTVANNLIALDDQVKTNADAIGTLNGSKSTTDSVSYKIDTEAQGASYTDTTTQLGANTIQGAIGAVDTRLDTLEGDASSANSVLGKIKANAAGADFETNNSNTNFNASATSITAAIDQLDTAVYNLKNGGDSVANQIKEQAENADFTNTGTNITANTVAGAITEVSNRQVPVYTSWGANGAAGTPGKVSLVAPGA